MVPSRDGLETGIIIFAIAFTIFAVMGVAHFTSGAHFGLPFPIIKTHLFQLNMVSRWAWIALAIVALTGMVQCGEPCKVRHMFRICRGDRCWLTSFAPKVRFSKNGIIFANSQSVHTF